MKVSRALIEGHAGKWLHEQRTPNGNRQTQLYGRTDGLATNITDLLDNSPSPASLATSTVGSIDVDPAISPSDTPSGSLSFGTTVLSIAVGCVAVFVVVPALAVLAFLYIRRWRRTSSGEETYKSVDDDQDDGFENFANGTRHYHDEIQLKDYENEGKPFLEEAGPSAAPMSAVHVMPPVLRQLSSESQPKALGSATIRSTGGPEV